MENQSRLFGYIYALVQNMADTEDLFQQTSSALWQKFDEFQPGTGFLAWARETARLEVLHFLRSRSRSRLQFDEDLVATLAETQAQLDCEESPHEGYLHAMNHCLGCLSDGDRRLVTLSYAEDCRIQQVATRYGRSSQSICNSLRRIRQALLRCIRHFIAAGGEDA